MMRVLIRDVGIVSCIFILFWFSSQGLEDDRPFRIGVVERHNFYRSIHNVPKVHLHELLSEQVQVWVEELTRIRDFRQNNDVYPHFAENIYTKATKSKDYVLPVNESVDSWYLSGIRRYDFEANYDFYSVGAAQYFAQIIWRETKYVGVGLYKKYSDGWITYRIVCRYYPGAVLGNFKGHVPKPTKNVSKSWFSFGVPVDDKAFINRVVERHNYYRAMHDAPKLKLDKFISKISQAWADTANTLSVPYSLSHYPGYGGTYYVKSHQEETYVLPTNESVDAWYKYGDGYNFEEEPNASTSLQIALGVPGFFTQLIWRESKFVGVGVNRRYRQGVLDHYVVCHYSPRGNILGKYRENVRKKTKVIVSSSTEKVSSSTEEVPSSTEEVPSSTETVPEFTGSTQIDFKILCIITGLYLLTRVYAHTHS